MTDNSLQSILLYCGCIGNHIPVILVDKADFRRSIQQLLERFCPKWIWIPMDEVSSLPFYQVVRKENGYILWKYCNRNSNSDKELLHKKGIVSKKKEEEKDINREVAVLLTTSGSTAKSLLY